MIIIKTINVNKSYYSETGSNAAISDCNISIKEGECVVISGTRSSGKTTLLRLIGGFEKPSGGAVYINNCNISLYTEEELAIMRKKEVGYLFQSDTLIPELTVHENIIMPIILARGKYDESFYDDMVKRMHLSEVLQRYPRQLSTVQLQCVAYARSLIYKPNIILMDEPNKQQSDHMDREAIDYLLDSVYEYRKTLIMVTSDPEVGFFADHVIKMRRGEIIEDIIQ